MRRMKNKIKDKKTFWGAMAAIAMIVLLVMSIIAWVKDKELKKAAAEAANEE